MKNYELKVFDLGDFEKIMDLFDKVTAKDIHQHPAYLKIFQEYSGTSVIYIYYGADDEFILIPYFKRPINHSNSNSKLIDLISPWYYGGPIFCVKDNELLKGIFKNFLKDFDEYCNKNGVVTEFQRFHPLLRNNNLYGNDSCVFFDRKIVYVDLTKDYEVINSEYTRHVRKNLNKALKSNLRVYEDKSKKGISQFISLYSESMKQKGAKKFYFFNEDFFNKLFDTFKEDIALFHVELDGKVISSSIELGKYGILHDYLRGCDPNYLELRPNDILIDTIIKWAKSKGYNYFSLGGGASPSEEDGILRFKRSFSSTTSDFYVYKKIHNLKAYNDLCSISGKKQSELKYEKAQFFPEYSE